MVEKILILGGTRDAARLAADLIAAGHDVTISLAGRTKEPSPLAGKIRTGGFSTDQKDGAQGLADYITEQSFIRLIDATHPFATEISRNAELAAKSTGIAFEVHQRPPWEKQDGDRWMEVANVAAAIAALPAHARVLLALGSQHIKPFAARDDVHFIIRMVDAPEQPLSLPSHELVLGRPAPDVESESELLKSKAISHIVCRNSGGRGAYAKIEAARLLGLPVIMIKRP